MFQSYPLFTIYILCDFIVTTFAMCNQKGPFYLCMLLSIEIPWNENEVEESKRDNFFKRLTKPVFLTWPAVNIAININDI